MGRHNSVSPVRTDRPPRRRSASRRERSPAREKEKSPLSHRSSTADKLLSRTRSPKRARSRSPASHSPVREKLHSRTRSPNFRKPPSRSPVHVRQKTSSQTRSPNREKSRSPPPLSPRSKRLHRAKSERDAEKGSEREYEKNHNRKSDRIARDEKELDRDVPVEKKDRRPGRDAAGNGSRSRREHSHSPSDRHHRGQRRSRSPSTSDNRGRNELTNSRDDEDRNGDSEALAKMRAVEESLEAKEKHKPSFELSGKLAAETNRVKGTMGLPFRESMNEALQLWKKISGKGDGSSDETKASSNDDEVSENADQLDKRDLGERESAKLLKDISNGSSPADPNLKGKGNNILDKAVGILKKKALTEKELNPEFFQKLETRDSDDLPVEVILPRRCTNPSNSQSEEEPESSTDQTRRTRHNYQGGDTPIKANYEIERGTVDGQRDYNQIESASAYSEFSRSAVQSEGFMNNKGNWMAIQRQLLLLERQQGHLMNMLQDFMGGSHDSMVTLENRVQGLERVVDDMARDLSISSSGRRGGSNMGGGYEGSSNRSLSKYNGFTDYSGGKSGRGSDGRYHFGERFGAFDGAALGMKSRPPSWRSDASDAWDFHSYGKNGYMGSRNIRSGKSENEADQVGSRRAWEKGAPPVRFGEGPSARSVWQASKDEATLEAIRVAGEDNGVSRGARVAIPEMTAEALGDDGTVQDRDPGWTSWRNAMDALHAGDVDAAFAEVLSTGDDVLLVKLMDRSGPVIDQLSNEVASEVLNAVSQLIVEPNLYDICLYWVQQLADIIMENGPDVLGTPVEVKREILLNLHEASSTIDLPDDWERSAPDQLLLQLANAWEIDLQHFGK